MAIKYLDAKRIRGSSTAPLAPRQGYDGGKSSDISGGSPAGGGGGSSAIGGTATGTGNEAVGGVGGAGTDSDILVTSSNVTRAGGGGGGTYSAGTGGAGGSGGGGAGGTYNATTAGGDATANTGSGGGGGSRTSSGSSYNAGGGDGGSGIVVLRFLTSGNSYSTSGSPTVTTNVSHTVVKYLASGTFTPAGSFDLAEYLVIAGGGGGGSGYAGGGGSGGYRTDTAYGVTAQEYTVTVGNGGAGGAASATNHGVKGSDSVFGSITSIGGGYGGEEASGGDGGSGGGAGWGSANVAGTGTGATSTDEKATLVRSTTYDGTVTGAIISTGTKKLGTGSVFFDGSNDYGSLDGLASSAAKSAINSISGWFNVTAGSDKKLFSWADTDSGGGNSYLRVGIHTNNVLDIVMLINGTSQWHKTTANGSFTGGSWHNLVITHNGTTPTIYVDGADITSGGTWNDQTDKTKWLDDDATIDNVRLAAISGYGSGEAEFGQVYIDDFACWSTVLPATGSDSVASLWNSGSGALANTVATSSLVAYYSMDSTTLTDEVSTTDLPENTLFEETDTYTSYFLQDNKWKNAGLYWSRGVFGGGYSNTNIMEYITLDTTGNVTDFGDLTVTRKLLSGLSSQTRGCFGGGENGGNSNVIDYITIATTGDATDFGNLTRSVANSPAPASSETRGLWAGGFESSNSNTIDYITIASTGNATDFGDTTQARNTHAGLSDTSRACFAGGSSYTNIIDYVTIDTTGNALDFGDLTVARSGLAGVDHKTRGVIMGGYTGSYVDTIDYITIQTLGNATDFGNLTSTRAFGASCASNTRGLFGGGGGSGGYVNIIEYITIVTLGDATDFGDLSTTRGDLGAVQG